jgi:hypothetical protein
MNLKNPYRGAKGMKAQMVPQTLARAIDSCRNKKTGLVTAGKPFRRGRLSTVDLLVLFFIFDFLEEKIVFKSH